jgi:peptide-methionine (S)-S-oxide reductase
MTIISRREFIAVKDAEPIVTQVKKLDKFYSAEDYHFDYFIRNERQPYCQFVVLPKIRKIEKDFSDILK